jgi:hypothetical protein
MKRSGEEKSDMRDKTNAKLSLAALTAGMPGLTPACGRSLAESAAVCLEDRKHPQGVQLATSGISVVPYYMDWLPIDDQMRRCYNDLSEATERGACGLAILVIREITGKVVVERSKKGPGFDYWLGDEEDDLLFAGKARLEVSGILSGSSSQMRTRVKQKKEQIRPSDHLAPGYVAVIEFSEPTAWVDAK